MKPTNLTNAEIRDLQWRPAAERLGLWIDHVSREGIVTISKPDQKMGRVLIAVTMHNLEQAAEQPGEDDEVLAYRWLFDQVKAKFYSQAPPLDGRAWVKNVVGQEW